MGALICICCIVMAVYDFKIYKLLKNININSSKKKKKVIIDLPSSDEEALQDGE